VSYLKEKPLKLQHKKFCEAYLQCGEGKQAAIEAGFKPESAANTASQLLKRHDIKVYLNCRAKRLGNKLEITTEWKCKLMVDMILAAANGKTTASGLPDARAVFEGIHLLTKHGIGGGYPESNDDKKKEVVDISRLAPLIDEYQKKLLAYDPN